MGERISAAEFARRDGCVPMHVYKAIQRGALVRGSDGKLDADLVGTSWRTINKTTKRNREARAAAQVAAPPVSPLDALPINGAQTVAQMAEQLVQQSAPYSRAEAERIKENYFALLRELEYKIKSRQVVDLEAAEAEFYSAARMSRDAWLHWPINVGPILAADLGLEADRVTELLSTLVHAHIARLSTSEPRFAHG